MNPVPQPVSVTIDRASFTIYSKDEIKRISVKKVTEAKSFEPGGNITKDGLYSLDLGPIKKFDACTTCGLDDLTCPGHYGHIELPVPVHHPMLVQVMYQMLNKCCLSCFHFRLSQSSLKLFLAQMDALNFGFDHLIDELDEIAADMCKSSDKRNKKKDYQDEKWLHIELNKKLVARISEEKEKATSESQTEKRPQQRSIVERLSRLFRNFINGTIIKPSRICPNCMEKKIPMYLHQQSVIVIGTNSSKPLDSELNELEEPPLPSKSKSKRRKSRKSLDDEDISYSQGYLNCLNTDVKKFLTPVGARHIFRELWRNEKQTMQRIFHFLNIEQPKVDIKTEPSESDDKDLKKKLISSGKFHPVDLFFVDTILVPPAKFRPPMMQRGYSYEGPRTAALSSVLKQSIVVQDLLDKYSNETDEIESEKLQPKLQTAWKDLQIAVNCIFDNEMDKYNKVKYPGLKQLIDKKEGLFRKNMMGKRVNFAARSVISPDPNISVDEIGVPLVFAMKLTYPEAITAWNLEELRQVVLNGPKVYPGAMSIVFDDGTTVSLIRETTRQSIASRLNYVPRLDRFKKASTNLGSPVTTIVNRHLRSGDVLLFNRQPTLHKPSIMAFRARVLPNEKGFRLHYANCKSFNADFDGDEMNAHLPQSELARSEAYHIASVNYQYLVPKDGSPLSGLIQDHVVAVCILTSRDQFYDRDRYNQLVYCSLSFLGRKLRLEPPTIWRPGAPLWTGKQVITTIIKNCIPEGKAPPTLTIKSKIGPKILKIPSNFEDMSDCGVVIRHGELIKGFMDKSNVGATQYGLVHTCYELYGGETSSALMSAFARLATWFLQLYEGFTLGIADILVDEEANADRKETIEGSKTVGPDSARDALGLSDSSKLIDGEDLVKALRDAHADRNPLPMKKLDAAMKSRTDKAASEISGRCLPGGLIKPFPANNLQMMIQSGAKGGTVNALQISCLLGQIELEGRRVPLSMSGRSLPSFAPYDTSPKAGGFVSGRFLTGIQPQEFFFHCMAGREGLIDTAVKTSRSGYLQRCLIKHLEGLTVHYDQTVRDSCGSVIQFLYGEDGLDIVKSQMLKEKAYSLLVDNYRVVKPSDQELESLNKSREVYEDELIARTNEIQEWMDQNGEDRQRNIRGSGFLDFLAARKAEDGLVTQRANDEPYFEAWYALSFKEKKKWNRHWELCPDPLTAILNPAAHFGVVPERLDKSIEEFVKNSPHLVVDPSSLFGRTNIGLSTKNVSLSQGDSLMAVDETTGGVTIKTECQDDDQAIAQQKRLTRLAAIEENAELSKSLMGHLETFAGRPDLRPRMTKHQFYDLCYNLYMKKLAEPGEAVGLLAAQSIGEPSTQMTLNTFHFAGRGEMNVTLGIPRLREILMTASAKIATPSMDLPMLKVMHDPKTGLQLTEEACEQRANEVRLALNAIRLSDVLEYVDITERIVDKPWNEAIALDEEEKDDEDDGLVAIESELSGARKRLKLSASTNPSSRFEDGTGNAMTTTKKSSTQQSASSKRTSSKKKAAFQAGDSAARSVEYQITFCLLRSKYYRHEFQTSSSKVMKFIKETFVDQLLEAMKRRQSRLKIAASMFDLSTRRARRDGQPVAQGGASEGGAGGGAANGDREENDPEEQDLENYNANAKANERRGTGEEGDSSSEDEEDNDGADITARRLKDRRNQDLDYDEPEEDDLEVGELDASAVQEEEQLPEDFVGAELGLDSNEAVAPNLIDDDEANYEQTETKKNKSKMQTLIDQEKNYKLQFPVGRDRTCKLTVCLPLTSTRLDMASLIESESRRTFVYQVGNIQRSLLVKDTQAKERGASCDKMIKTEGVSLLALVRYNHVLDLNRIYSNDIHAIANNYGIEAASQAIRREMSNVFAVYGIEVDSHHLSLIADYMTYNGSIRGMNRMTMEASASPFQQMSFESTLRYLKWAAILGLYDDIKSPSASLVFGRPSRVGTGLFATRLDAAKVAAAAANNQSWPKVDATNKPSRRTPWTQRWKEERK